jgi:hypothetical protein
VVSHKRAAVVPDCRDYVAQLRAAIEIAKRVVRIDVPGATLHTVQQAVRRALEPRRSEKKGTAMVIPELGNPVDFYQRHFPTQWWIAHILSYAELKAILKGEGLHEHHLVPKSLFLRGALKTRNLIDYVPSVPLAEAEHLKTLHSALNEWLRKENLWQRDLSAAELRRAIDLVSEFYERHGLRHFAAAVRAFRKEAYDRVA